MSDRIEPETVDGGEDLPPRYIIGIDLGTTNCAAAWIDTEGDSPIVRMLSIPQWVDADQFESRSTLPSFLYQPSASQRPSGRLPWEEDAEDSNSQTTHCTGVFARDSATRHAGRVIASAKSWLSHPGVDRSTDLLPWHGDAEVQKMSPVEASSRYLRHIAAAWDDAHPDHPMADQDVVITLPASFDEVARELTVSAARRAGLPRVFLIEEPQAAFYAWIDDQNQDWQSIVRPGQLILVCDIGGGTTDFTLIRVRPAGGGGGSNEASDDVQFHRVAVGRHLILGGDNLDLAIAKFAESKLDAALPPESWQRLIAASRNVKETMLAEDRPDQITVHLAGGGSRVIGGGTDVTITAEEIDRVIVGGFFPAVKLEDAPESGGSGFAEFGLPYAADPAITRHLAEFLSTHRRTGAVEVGDEDRPALVLFNGGVMAAPRLQSAIVDSLSRWFGDGGYGDHDPWRPAVLSSPRLHLAVARGAAYYGIVRRGRGVRIAANLGHSYYLQVDEAPPAAMCLIAGSAEAGQTFLCDDRPLRLNVGVPVRFPLWSSSTRLADPPGEVIEIDSAEMSPLPPIATVLTTRRRNQTAEIDVAIESQLSEIGTVAIHAVDVTDSGGGDGPKGRRWRLEFDIRSTLETDRSAHGGTGESAGIVDEATAAECCGAIEAVFAGDEKPSKLMRRLQSIVGEGRDRWPPSLLRRMWRTLVDHDAGRRRSPGHETRWLNLTGFCLRPGFGVAADDWRVATTYRRLHGKLAFAAPASRTESMILWRRIGGGLTAGQQIQLAGPLVSKLRGGVHGKSKLADHEFAEAWRLVASMEHLPVADKRVLIDAAIVGLDRVATGLGAADRREVLVWSLGRLASRLPVYGPIHLVVDPETAWSVCQALLSIDGAGAGVDLAVVQAARLTGDRFRDLPVERRERVAGVLGDRGVEEGLLEIVRVGGVLAEEEQAVVLGDALPLGLRLGT